jgi:hypothetical protein
VKRSFARGGVQPSSEAELRPMGRPALERGEVSPEGASSPQARRSFTRGGVQPLGEAEFRWYGDGPLEGGGDSAEGGARADRLMDH